MLRALWSLAAAAAVGFSGPVTAIEGAGTPCSSAFIEQAQHALDDYRAQSHVPGIAVAIYDHGASCLLSSGTRGPGQSAPVTPDTAFAMGSVEKVFNSTLLALAIAQGKVSLDDPAAKYLITADGRRVRTGAPFREVTLRNLVTHTSALPRQPPGKRNTSKTLFTDRPLPIRVVRFLDDWQPMYPPGTRYVYSNFGFVLVGEAAVHLGGKPYTRLLTEDVTGPLDMPHTGMLCQRSGPECAVASNAKGRPEREQPVGLWTTSRDMLRFVEANLGVVRMPPLLAKALDITHQELFRVDKDHAVGMAWEEWHHGDDLLLSKDGL
ncbi:MAG: serine hydrolase, partial [Casimicrobiaceae bacterium]